MSEIIDLFFVGLNVEDRDCSSYWVLSKNVNYFIIVICGVKTYIFKNTCKHSYNSYFRRVL